MGGAELAPARKCPDGPVIDSPPSASHGNAYRQILRRRAPEPLLALLLFIMGVWLWDNHFGPAAGYDEETCRMALLKTDRDLRLASVGAALPGLLRAAVDVPPEDRAVRDGIASFMALAKVQALDDEGAYALEVLTALRDGRNPAASAPGAPLPEAVAARFAEGRDRWWDTAFLAGVRDLSGPDLLPASCTSSGDPRNLRLLSRAEWSRGGALLLALAGVAFVPRALRESSAALRRKPGRDYPGAWRLGLGLGVFLVSYLASVGFAQVIDGVIHGPGDGSAPVALSLPVLLALDTAARLLPALVAVALLFRRGGHVMSRFGLRKMPDLSLVLGMYALLTAANRLLGLAGAGGSPDPAGGLSSLEAGGWGLAYMAVSACLVAPATEEVLYRGVLFQTLANRFPAVAATLISSLVFAVVHFYDAWGLAAVGLTGAACALCFRARGALTSAILLHICYNSLIKLPAWLVYHQPL